MSGTIFKMLKGRGGNRKTVILYPVRLSFRVEGKIRNFSDKN